MIYTLGKTEMYERYFLENCPEPTYKLGRRDDLDGEFYPGGSVWEHYEEAVRHAESNPGYAVYTVEADWDKDTCPSQDGDWHDLLRDAVILESLPIVEQYKGTP